VLDDHNVLASIGSVADAYDNAMAESFVDSFKTELIADRVWRSRRQLELAIVEYIGWFNHDRLHEALGDIAPVEFEQRNPTGVDFGQRIGRGAPAEGRRSPLHASARARTRRHRRNSTRLDYGTRTRRLRRLDTYMKIGNHETRSPSKSARLKWAYALEYASSDARRASLPHWVRHYNERRTHSALGNRPPLARVREVTGLNN
jgi:hypothetical protein